MASAASHHQESARKFVDHCISKFRWTDLSNDVIMDIGCGADVYCGRSILESFPHVQSMVGIDKNLMVVRKFNSNPIANIRCDCGDIESRMTLQDYEGMMTKVISTHMFHQLTNKKLAFENIYRLLRPGGEAAILFVMATQVHAWIKEMLKNPKWREKYQGNDIFDFFAEELGTLHYKEMVQNIGFQIVDCSEDKVEVPFPSDEVCKAALYRIAGDSFKVLPESAQEFKEDSFQVVEKLGGRNEKGIMCYRSIELSLLLVKPTEESCCKTRPNTVL